MKMMKNKEATDEIDYSVAKSFTSGRFNEREVELNEKQIPRAAIN